MMGIELKVKCRWLWFPASSSLRFIHVAWRTNQPDPFLFKLIKADLNKCWFLELKKVWKEKTEIWSLMPRKTRRVIFMGKKLFILLSHQWTKNNVTQILFGKLFLLQCFVRSFVHICLISVSHSCQNTSSVKSPT